METRQDIVINMLLNYLSADASDLFKVFTIAEKLDSKNNYSKQINTLKKALLEENSIWRVFIKRLFDDVDLKIIKKFVRNFLIYGHLIGSIRNQELASEFQCSIPKAIVIDPTNACNQSCEGCYNQNRKTHDNLDYNIMDSIINQAKELGTHFFIFSGGEPLLRQDDLINLSAKHQDCFFLAFTNGTIIDNQLCEKLLDVGNLALALSIDGDMKNNDTRRGKGSYEKTIEKMKLLESYKLLYGYSACYNRLNAESLGSDEFVNKMINSGCRFAFNFPFTQNDTNNDSGLEPTQEQHKYILQRIRTIRQTKPLFAINFHNDKQLLGGCMAAGKEYMHINAAGDVKPCVFVEYTNRNIHHVTLLEALYSPLFAQFQSFQSSKEHDTAICPLKNDSELLTNMIKRSRARSIMEKSIDKENLSNLREIMEIKK